MDDNALAHQREYIATYEPLYRSLAARIADLLGGLLSDAQIPVVQIEHRAKTVESFLGKLARKAYSDPFSEIKDFAGIRVITYYADDVDKIAQILRSEFDVDSDHSTDKMDDLDVDEFGYRSFHLVCAVKPPRSELAEWRQYNGLSFEVQVRSVLQHAWAAISHKLDYKTARQAPKEVRRQLYRLSALLELGDQEFAAIRDRTHSMAEEYRENVDKGHLEIPLNLSSLTEYINERVNLEEWRELGKAAGLADLIGEVNRERDIELFFETLTSMKVHTIRELDDLIAKHKKSAQALLTRFSKACQTRGYRADLSPEDSVHVFVALAEHGRLPKGFAWDDPWLDEVQDAMNELLLEDDKTSG